MGTKVPRFGQAKRPGNRGCVVLAFAGVDVAFVGSTGYRTSVSLCRHQFGHGVVADR